MWAWTADCQLVQRISHVDFVKLGWPSPFPEYPVNVTAGDCAVGKLNSKYHKLMSLQYKRSTWIPNLEAKMQMLMPEPQIFVERTLALIKPDVIDKEEEIEDLILRSGFLIVQVTGWASGKITVL